MFSLNLKDVAKSLVTAFFTGVVVSIAGVVSTSGFDVFAAPWVSIFHVSLSAGVATALGYLIKNYFSNAQGKVFGKIG